MQRHGLTARALFAFGVCLGLGAAPAAPSYQAVNRTIEKIRTDFTRPGGPSQPNEPGWIALLDTIVSDLRAYSAAPRDRERLIALNRLYQVSVSLGSVGWGPAAELREALREWLRPRVRLAWAERRLVDRIQGMPASTDAGVGGNRARWVKFVASDLSEALKAYDGASTVRQRAEALGKVTAALTALQTRNQTYPWNPSLELQGALNDLYNLPNLDISADVATLSPLFNVNLVTDGPVYRKGYVSQVTAGPKTGFGLMNSDNGIAFFNSQLLNSVTPIHDFQQQIANDQKGKRVAKLYQFGATSTDTQQLTIVTVLRATGLEIYPSFGHNVGLNVSSAPQRGGGLGRAVASLIGFNQPKVTDMVRQNAIGPMQQKVVQEAMEMGLEKTSAEAARRNSSLRQFLIGYNRLAFRNILIEGLSLRSQPTNALIGGTLRFLNGEAQIGADAPQPPAIAVPDSGVSADIHLSSVLSNFARGFLQTEEVKQVENVMIVTADAAPNSPPGAGAQVTRNADYPTFLKAIDAARAADNPKVQALRVKRPSRPPDFGVDSQGNLVAIVRDFQLDVPAPPQAAKGGATGPPARVYRISAPVAEFSIAFKVDAKSQVEPIRLNGQIVNFDPGPGARVIAIDEDESKAQPLTTFSTRIVLGIFKAKLQGQPIDLPLSSLQLRGFAIRSVSPLDPTGWIRVNLVRTSDSPAAGIQ